MLFQFTAPVSVNRNGVSAILQWTSIVLLKRPVSSGVIAALTVAVPPGSTGCQFTFVHPQEAET
jgi:hypothetical protein